MAHQAVQPLEEVAPAAKRQKIAAHAMDQSFKPGADIQGSQGPGYVTSFEPVQPRPHTAAACPIASSRPAQHAHHAVPLSKASGASDVDPAPSHGIVQNGSLVGRHSRQPNAGEAMFSAPALSDLAGAAGSAKTAQPHPAGPDASNADQPASTASPAQHETPWHASAEMDTSNGSPAQGGQAPDAAPAASGDVKPEQEEEEVATGKVERAVKAVATATGCDICGEVMRDPVTAPECMHSFCAVCIDEFIFDLQARTCPVCQLEGVSTNLGNMPYHHHRLQFDFTLADVIRKLFPRPEVERQIEERRRDERRFMEQAQRKGQQSEASTPSGSPGGSLPGFAPASANMITLLLLPAPDQQAPLPHNSSKSPALPSADGHSMPVSGTLANGPNVSGTSQSNPTSSTSEAAGLPGNHSHTLTEASEAHANGNDAESPEIYGLERPYLRVDKGLSVSKLQQYVASKLQEHHAERAQRQMVATSPCDPVAAGLRQPLATSLYHHADRLAGESTLEALYGQQPASQMLLLHYRQVEA